jgi:putative resolvase
LFHPSLGFESFCAKHGWTFEILQDLGSGLNYSKKGLRKLIKEICSGSVDRLVITHKDCLLRFGAELVFALCEQFGTEVVMINAASEANFEDDLVQDVLEIITVFSARLYGSRSRKNQKVLEALKDAASQI